MDVLKEMKNIFISGLSQSVFESYNVTYVLCISYLIIKTKNTRDIPNMLKTYLQQLGVCSKQKSTCFFLQYRYPVLLVKLCLYLLSGRSYILERYIDSFVINCMFQPIGLILQRTWKKNT
jgi:hypothetical protein